METSGVVEQAEQYEVTIARELPVDPFEFFPGIASKIAGLGGGTPGHDHNYVFHTGYFEAAPGPSRFIIQFHGLTARRGTLWLRVHMLPMEQGARAVLANSERIQLNRLIQNGGRAEIRFEGFRRMSFGLYAGIQEETDAKASAVEVWFDRPAEPDEQADTIVDIRNTSFGRDVVRPVVQMLSSDRADFGAPVTQVATRPQTRDPAYREAQSDLSPPRDALEAWKQLYVARVLRRYGMLEPGARGLGINVGASPLPARIAAAGLSVVTLDPDHHAAGEDGIERRIAPLDPLPPDLVNFDCLWSIDAWAPMDSPAAALRYLESTMAALRPGGLAVHVGGYRLHGQGAAPSATLLTRPDVERFLLVVISRGHEVAQFRYDAHDAMVAADGTTGAVGMIVRKAPSVL